MTLTYRAVPVPVDEAGGTTSGGTSGGTTSADAVLFTSQVKTESQKLVARGNIGGKRDNGRIVASPPTGIAATDRANMTAFLADCNSANTAGELHPGTYNLAGGGSFVIDDGADVQGVGGGFADPQTILLLGASGDSVVVQGGGGVTGGFMVNGANTATLPFQRLGGAGSAGRTLSDLAVWYSAQDIAAFTTAQNDLVIKCVFGVAARDLLYLDQGVGGTAFAYCELVQNGRYGIRIDSALGAGPYPEPSDLEFHKCIIEGSGSVSQILITDGYNIRFIDMDVYSTNNLSGPSIDIVNGSAISFSDLFLQQTGSTLTAGTIGIRAQGVSRVAVYGMTRMLNIDKPLVVDGTGSLIDDKSVPWVLNNGAAWRVATGGAGVDQVQAWFSAPLTRKSDTASHLHALSQNAASTTNWFWDRIDGTRHIGDGTTVNSDVAAGRQAAGVYGVAGQQVLRTGSGTTAQRPSASLAAGMVYANSTTGFYEWSDGTNWVAVVPTSRTVTAGTGLTGGGDLSANRTLTVAYGTTTGTAAQGDDARFTAANLARVPYATLTSSGTATVNFATNGHYGIVLNANTTISITNPPTTGTSQSVLIELVQGTGGSRTVTWPAAVKWPGGTAPTLSTALNSDDVVELTTRNGGTTYIGRLIGLDVK